MNNYDTSLEKLIYLEKESIPKQICKKVVGEISSREWHKHSWGDGSSNSSHSYEDKELSVQGITPDLEQILNQFILKSGLNYQRKYSFNHARTKNIVNYFSSIRFNRYENDQIMRIHCDHIHAIFDGNLKGIPVLSFIMNLNADYEGADLIFWDDYKVSLGEGDILIFPSLFLFPHRVTEPTKGIRYSGVCWAW
jgi:predicted 2-oxoglutarate/Fe(II)-dependent dioxygenase YbiX